ncbi:MAG: acyltransferase [Promethearchaeota archaeon]|nr:MAG: acyltransferase [Candidatus Lokiarchaeota archaeon]
MKVGYIQTSPIFGETAQNFKQVENLLGNTKADLIVLPELFATGYTFVSKEEAESMAENTKGETTNFLMRLAEKTDAVVVGGFIEKEGNHIFNSSMIVSKGEVLGTYRKLHLYYKEKLWFSPGNKPLKIYEVKNTKVGIMICFDWFFPETFRTLALLGAEIIAHPANLVLPYCQKAMETRCLINRVFAVTSNRIGNEVRGEDNFTFTGGSQITSYNGEVLSSAPKDKQHIDFVEIDVKHARDKNLNYYNNLFEERRVEFYYDSDKS